jgi:hypothetical protein
VMQAFLLDRVQWPASLYTTQVEVFFREWGRPQVALLAGVHLNMPHGRRSYLTSN